MANKPNTEEFEHAAYVLNNYRNEHYNDCFGESGSVAEAINTILPFAVSAYYKEESNKKK